VAAIRETGALAACMDLARRYAEEAIRHLSTLPRSPCCAALAELARYAVDRSV
jgi:geranylgeranyl pyrophosphate synthase